MQTFWIARNGSTGEKQPALNSFDALKACNNNKWRLLTNLEHENILKIGARQPEGEKLVSWAGPLGAYSAPSEKLGQRIRFSYRFSTGPNTGPLVYLHFEVPHEYQNEKNAILVVQHGFIDKPLFTCNISLDSINGTFNHTVQKNQASEPFFSQEDFNALVNKGKLEKGSYLFQKLGESAHVSEKNGTPLITIENENSFSGQVNIADPFRIEIVRDFPSSDGWYMPEEKFGIPVGDKVSEYASGARRLLRHDAPFVGFFIRGPSYGQDVLAADVGTCPNPSWKRGALVADLD